MRACMYTCNTDVRTICTYEDYTIHTCTNMVHTSSQDLADCVYMHAWIHSCIHITSSHGAYMHACPACRYTHVYVCINIYLNAYSYMHEYIHIRMYRQAPAVQHTCLHTCRRYTTHAYMYVCIYMCVCVYIYIYIYIYMAHSHIHT
jgi:hypothetical protein